jgi:hypothetical protein
MYRLIVHFTNSPPINELHETNYEAMDALFDIMHQHATQSVAYVSVHFESLPVGTHSRGLQPEEEEAA